MLTFDLTGKVAIVTGASSGLGVQFSKALALQGATVILLARREEKLKEIAREIESAGGKSLPIKCDVASEESVKMVVEQVANTFGKIDILVNNAGVSEWGNLWDFSLEKWEKVIDINLTGPFLMTREVSRYMKERKYGRIINIASVGGLRGGVGQLPYYATKGGIVNFTRACAGEMAPYNVTVNAICPGMFPGEMTQETMKTDIKDTIIKQCPLRRLGKEGELNGALIYFASEESSYTTAQTLAVDGGMLSQVRPAID